MAAITFKGFRGAIPRSGQRLQQPRYASSARNIKITSGNIVPLKGLQLSSTTLAASIATIWRYRHMQNGIPQDNWLTFSKDTDVVKTLVANDPNSRVYWSSEAHEPRMSIYSAAISGPGPYPAAFYRLGIPSPTAAPSVAHSGGVGTNVNRAYAYTFVSALGEESGPSPASAVATGKPDGTWAITGMQAAPANGDNLAGWTNLPGGRVSIGLTDTTWVDVGHEILISGALQTKVFGLGADINGRHRVLAVNRSTHRVEVALPTQNGGAGGTWTFVAPINTTGMVKRIYRTEGTSAAFLFVAEIPVGDTSYNDTVTTLTGEVLPTLSALPPPGTLKCLVDLPNGCLCGLTENEVCFSEPYQPYSWPIANRYSFVGRGVALCPVVNSVIVLTDGMPIMLTGSDPAAMSPIRIETYAPCVSKRGAVNVGGGVLYPSHDGLWLASASGVAIKSRALYRTDEWEALAPATFDAEFHDGQYFAVHTPVGGKKQILVLDVSELDSAVSVDETADALYRNDYDGKLYAAKGAEILRWDASDSKRYFSEWTSVEVQLDQPRNFGHAQVHANWKQVVPLDQSILIRNQALIAAGPNAVNGHVLGGEFNSFELNGSNLGRYQPPTERRVQFILLDETGPIFSYIVPNARPFRLPAGFEQEVVRVGISSSVEVYSATIAQSTEELAQAST